MSAEKPLDKTISQGDGWIITTSFGWIDYRPTGEGVNEIWWIQSSRPGGGTDLVDLMMAADPADAISWGVTTTQGEGLRKKYHREHPDVADCDSGPHEGQFNPFEAAQSLEFDDED